MKSIWSNPKYKGTFTGFYQELNGERVFNLSNGKKVFTFESFQMAKKLGWIKIK